MKTLLSEAVQKAGNLQNIAWSKIKVFVFKTNQLAEYFIVQEPGEIQKRVQDRSLSTLVLQRLWTLLPHPCVMLHLFRRLTMSGPISDTVPPPFILNYKK